MQGPPCTTFAGPCGLRLLASLRPQGPANRHKPPPGSGQGFMRLGLAGLMNPCPDPDSESVQGPPPIAPHRRMCALRGARSSDRSRMLTWPAAMRRLARSWMVVRAQGMRQQEHSSLSCCSRLVSGRVLCLRMHVGLRLRSLVDINSQGVWLKSHSWLACACRHLSCCMLVRLPGIAYATCAWHPGTLAFLACTVMVLVASWVWPRMLEGLWLRGLVVVMCSGFVVKGALGFRARAIQARSCGDCLLGTCMCMCRALRSGHLGSSCQGLVSTPSLGGSLRAGLAGHALPTRRPPLGPVHVGPACRMGSCRSLCRWWLGLRRPRLPPRPYRANTGGDLPGTIPNFVFLLKHHPQKTGKGKHRHFLV